MHVCITKHPVSVESLYLRHLFSFQNTLDFKNPPSLPSANACLFVSSTKRTGIVTLLCLKPNVVATKNLVERLLRIQRLTLPGIALFSLNYEFNGSHTSSSGS